MKKKSPKFIEASKKIDNTKNYNVEEAINLVKEVAFAKFDETIELAYRLGVDPSHADQMIQWSPCPSGGNREICKSCSNRFW
jgi:large subunit ribosomal protein L1